MLHRCIKNLEIMNILMLSRFFVHDCLLHTILYFQRCLGTRLTISTVFYAQNGRKQMKGGFPGPLKKS